MAVSLKRGTEAGVASRNQDSDMSQSSPRHVAELSATCQSLERRYYR